jgi:hypothetical protein
MKRRISAVILFLCLAVFAKGQNRANYLNEEFQMVSKPGYVNISDLNFGISLRYISKEYSGNYYGITNISAYQISENFLAGAGIGIYTYNKGSLIPLFLDIRYYNYFGKFSPFLFADGGLLISSNDLNKKTRLFIDPGIGINKKISKNVMATFGTGVMVQMGSFSPRDSFLNFKLGISYISKN